MRDLSWQFMRVEVRSGNHTSFWNDVGSPLECLKEVVGDGGTMAIGIAENALMIDVLLNHRRRRHRVSI